MKIRFLLPLVALLLLLSATANAQDKGYWRSASTNANSITGDLIISETSMDLYFHKIPISRIRNLKPEEIIALFDADTSIPGTGFLYRVRIASGTRLMRDNTLCGSNDAEWMVSYISGRTMKVAFFSGEEMPELTFEALNKSMDDCGHFTYAR